MKVINKITMKQLCLLLTILILPTLGFGQFIGDSVIVYVDNRVEVKLAVPDYFALKSSHDAVQALENFIKVLPEIEDQLSADAPELVKFSGGSVLTVEPGESRVIYLQKEGAFSNTGFRDQAIVSGKDYTIMITATDLSMISDLPLLNCLNSVIALLPEKRSWPRSLYYECIDGKVTELEVKNNEFDILEINFGAGAGLVRNTWVPDLSMSVGLGFNKKGNIRLPYVSSNMLFDFSSEGKTNVNTFLNLGYGWNKTKSTRKGMLGVELGYLVSRQGDLFGENTFRLGFNWSPVKGVYVSPHLYGTDNFKTVFPGIRIGFGI